MSKEKPIKEKKIVQSNLSGGAAITTRASSKKDFVLSAGGYRLKISETSMESIPDKVQALVKSKKYSPGDIGNWKDAFVINKIRAIPFLKHLKMCYQVLHDGMVRYVFDSQATVPRGIIPTEIITEFIEWECPKYRVKTKKDIWESKKAKWIKWLAKTSKKHPEKWKLKTDADMRAFIGKKMKLKTGLFSTEGEYQGYLEAYLKELYRLIGAEEPQLAPGQKTLKEGDGKDGDKTD